MFGIPILIWALGGLGLGAAVVNHAHAAARKSAIHDEVKEVKALVHKL